jgi:integrase
MIQAVVLDDDGNRKTKATVWQNPENLTGVKAKNSAIAFGEIWERRLKNYEFEQPEIRPRKFISIANEWLEIKTSSVSESYASNARHIITHLNKAFGDKYMRQIRVNDVYEYFTKINNASYTITKARVKPDKLEEFHDKILEYGQRKLRKDIACPTINQSWKGANVELSTATMFCVRLGINTNGFFERVTMEKRYLKSTISRHRKILSAIFNYAISLEQATHNYASPAHLKDKIGGLPSKETKILSDSEMERFESLLDTKSIFTSIPFYIMMYTGMRRAEMCGLHWDDIDLVNRVIHIKRDRIFVSGKGAVERETKTKYSVRKVPIIPKLYDKLVKMKEAVEYWIQNGECKHVVCLADGTPRGPLNIGKIFQRLLVEADCPLITLHKLRHWFVTYMITANAPINTVAKLVGHANTATTLKIYTQNKMTDEETKNLMESIFHKKDKD